jgi:hypothetical protein
MRRAGDQRSQVKDEISHFRGKRLLHLTSVNDRGAPAVKAGVPRHASMGL